MLFFDVTRVSCLAGSNISSSQIVGLRSDWLGAEVDSSAKFVTDYLRDLQIWTRQTLPSRTSDPSYVHIFGVESNLGRESSWIEGAIGNQGGLGVKILREAWTPQDGQFRSGVCTTNATKQTSVQILETLMQNDGITFVENGLYDAQLSSKPKSDQTETFLNELNVQMRAWRKVSIPTRTPGAPEKFAYTGKAGPDNKNCNKMRDDLLMALLLNIYWLKVYLSGSLKNWIYE